MRGSPPGLDDQAADPAVRGGEALRSQHCAARSAVQVWLRAAPRGEDLKEAGGRRPPASFKTSPLPRLDSLLGTLTPAGGGVRGGGGGRPRPFGMLPWRGREAARRDHQPQLVYELMTRDTGRLLKKASERKEAGICGGVGEAHTPTYADSSPSGLAFSACPQKSSRKAGCGGWSVMKRPWLLRGTVLFSGRGAFSSPCWKTTLTERRQDDGLRALPNGPVQSADRQEGGSDSG